MTVYPQQNNAFLQKSATPDYDLQSEKQRIAEGTEEIKKELFEKWQRQYANAQIFPAALSGINPALLDHMLAFDLTVFYNELARKFGFSPEQRNILPQLVWKTVIGKSWNNLENLVADNLKINQSAASQLVQLVNQRILLKAKELSEKPFVSERTAASRTSGAETVKITLSQALQKYPALGEKLITANPIKLKIFPSPVRPSIKNWIADYHQVVGAGSHGSMERANYLYHSENTKNLNPSDRQKLAAVLKSIDENEPVTIDTENLQIIFSGQGALTPALSHRERGDKDEAPQKSFPGPQDYFKRNAKPDEYKNVQFSYPQKMSSETLTPRRVFPPENPNRLPQKQSQDESYRPDRIHHLSEDNGNNAESDNGEPEPKVQGNVVDLKNL